MPEWMPEAGREIADPLERLQACWPELVARCGMVQPMLEQFLRDSMPVSLNDTTLVIGFDPEFAGEIEQVRHLERGMLRNLFRKVIGHSVRLDYTVLKTPVKWSHHAPEAGAAADDGAEEGFDPETAGLNPRAWLRNESVRTVLEAFHGDIIDIQT